MSKSKRELEAKIASLESDVKRERDRAECYYDSFQDTRKASRKLLHAHAATDAIRAALIDGSLTLEAVTTDRTDEHADGTTTHSLIVEFRSRKSETVEAVAAKVRPEKLATGGSISFNIGGPISWSTPLSYTSPLSFRFNS